MNLSDDETLLEAASLPPVTAQEEARLDALAGSVQVAWNRSRCSPRWRLPVAAAAAAMLSAALTWFALRAPADRPPLPTSEQPAVVAGSSYDFDLSAFEVSWTGDTLMESPTLEERETP